jgi:Protein of unknown function (DUF1488)
MFFSFPPDAHWNPERDAVEFTVEVGEYRGSVRIRRDVFRRFLDGAVIPERCVEAYHLQRTRLELVVERKLRQRQLSEDGNVEITGRDLREPADREPTALSRKY